MEEMQKRTVMDVINRQYKMRRSDLKNLMLAHKDYCGSAVKDMIVNGVLPTEITINVIEMLTERFLDEVLEHANDTEWNECSLNTFTLSLKRNVGDFLQIK